MHGLQRSAFTCLFLTTTCPRYDSPLLLAGSPRRGTRRLPDKKPSASTAKEKHLIFDAAQVVARGGPGGRGAVISLPRRGDGPMLRRTADDDFELPPGGGHGGDVILFVDPAKSDLLHLHGRPKLIAPRGGDSLGLRDLPAARARWRKLADDAASSCDASSAAVGMLSSIRLRDGAHLRVPVPPGTFVRTSSGRVLGDLIAAGQELRVAAGGEGGPCILREEPRGADGKPGKGKRSKGRSRNLDTHDGEGSVDAFALSDDELQSISCGGSAQEVKLDLVLRTVADVGFVGFPNAGKSTLLAALSRASPEVAPFPFTTLMPNLGAMAAHGPETGAGGVSDSVSSSRTRRMPAPLLADLPGLVEGAHAGKGLGRLFLRHLRRVRVVLYVLDTSNEEPSVSEQYIALRRELELYNPQYLARPHVVALNKLDLPLASGGEAALTDARRTATRSIAEAAASALDKTAKPVAIVPISGLKGKGMRIMREALDNALAHSYETEQSSAD